ncbi:MAG TPA: peptidoglycan-associated lipoprotein Pal [Thermoanaerobaculia bacterium]|nr:peptidoglycan-associated lipoprotein Pal [Thermoanaerobaculia bacterium]
MTRKWLIWIALPILAAFVYGCPKKKPATKPSDLNVETTTMPAPTTPTTDITPPKTTPPPAEPSVDPMSSEDLSVVNAELRKRGFSPDVYFEYDESNLSDDARAKLSRNAELLKTQPRLSVTIEGHCDARGTAEYNLALGERRANAAKSYLASLGVAADRMRTISYGKERPVCSEQDESCFSQNRRAHMVVTSRTTAG